MSAMKVITVVWFLFFILFGYIVICEADRYTKEEMEKHRKEGGDFPHDVVELSYFEKAIKHRFNRLWYTWVSKKNWNDSNANERINEIINNKMYDLSDSVYTDLDSMILMMNSLNEDIQKKITNVLYATMNHLTEEYHKKENKKKQNYLHNKIENCKTLIKNARSYTTVHDVKRQFSRFKTFGGSHHVLSPPTVPDTEENNDQ